MAVTDPTPSAFRTIHGGWDASFSSIYGAKGSNLMRLAAAGLPVPEGICLSSAANFADLPIPEFWKALSELPTPWSVRSSSLQEDSKHHAFPGLFKTILGIQRPPEVAQALSDISTGMSSETIKKYAPGVSSSTRIPALIQTIYKPFASGVIFTQHPINRDGTLLINASWGLGEPVVSGTLTPDEVTVNRRGRPIETRISAKSIAMNQMGHLHEVDSQRVLLPTLTQSQISVLTDTALAVEEIMNFPQDIEWMIDAAGDLWLLQSRPITTL